MIAHEMIEKIEEAAQLEGTEISEYWSLLTQLHRYRYCMSDEFEIALDKELTEMFNDINENWVIEETERTVIERYRSLVPRED